MSLKKWMCGLLSVLLLIGSFSFLRLDAKAVNRSGETYSSKKGLQFEFGMLSDVEDLGISEAFMNIVFEKILSHSPTKYSYDYQGATYYFQEAMLEQYDQVIKQLNDMGATVTVAFLNQYVDGYEYMLYTGEPHSGTIDYAFNTKDDFSRKTIEAITHFIASRYNGGDKGAVSRYVIGNEVNDNTQYNWTGEKDINEYVSVYYQTFKTFSDAIKAENSNALVYIPLEHRWNTTNSNVDYAGKDFLTIFNGLAKADGVDWNVAFHAYSYPTSNPNPLRDGIPSTTEKGEVTYGFEVDDTANSPLITTKNLHVLTDFLQKSEFLNAGGNVRSVILAEQGFTSKSNMLGDNETIQAAAIAYAYYTAEMNPYVDAFHLCGQTDAYIENQYLLFGLRGTNYKEQGSEKKAYNMYKYIDTKDSLEVTNFALETLGIEDWKYAIDNFDATKFQAMKTVDNGQMYSVSTMDDAQNASILSAGMGTSSPSDWDIITSRYWYPSYGVHQLSGGDYSGHSYVDLCTAVSDGDVYTVSSQAVQHTFDTVQDFNGKPYLGFKIFFDPHSNDTTQVNDTLNVRIRVYSGSHLYDANTNVSAAAVSNLFVDLSGWQYKNAVDKVAIWVSEVNKSKSFNGCIIVRDFMAASNLQNATGVEIGKTTSKRILTADPYTGQSWAWKWGSKDLSDEFNWENYYNSNAEVAAKYGKSPVLLFENYAKTNVTTNMYRLYNKYNGEHFYTASTAERDALISFGWNDEGIGWEAPLYSNTPVYRLYNKPIEGLRDGYHHYTTNPNERDMLVSVGWVDEGIGWYSDDSKTTPLYRQYNPNATGKEEPGNHNYTKDKHERDVLISLGWNDEDVAWYGK